MNMQAVRRSSTLEEHIPPAVPMALVLPHLSTGSINDLPAEAQQSINPRNGGRRYNFLLQEDVLIILMNFLLLRRADLPAAAITTEMLNCRFRSYDQLCALLSHHLLSELARRGSTTDNGQGPSSHSPGFFNDGSVVINIINPSSINPPQISSGRNSPVPGPYVSIDIGDVSNGSSQGMNSPPASMGNIIPSVVDQLQQQGTEPDGKKRGNTMIISETTLAITAQAVGTLLSSALSGSSHPSWTANFVAVATVYGIAFTVLGIGFRRVKPKLSAIMVKLGAVAMASAIILALGLAVVPAVAWPAGTLAFLLIAVGVVMA